MMAIKSKFTAKDILNSLWSYEIIINTHTDKNSGRHILKELYYYFRNKGLVLSKSDDTSLQFKVPYFSSDFDSSFRGIRWIKTEMAQKENQIKLKVVFKNCNYYFWVLIPSIFFSYLDHRPFLQCDFLHFIFTLFLIYSVWIVSLFFIIRYGLNSTVKKISYEIFKSLHQNKKTIFKTAT